MPCCECVARNVCSASLELKLPGLALILELLDQIDSLQQEVGSLKRRLQELLGGSTLETLEAERDRPAQAIAAWSFPQLRQYVHYLVKHERWADGFSSPILEALVAGHLQQVADRLESDDSLYEPG